MADQTAQSDEVVTQEDREAAANLLGGATPDGLIEGRCDSLSLIQTLVRHRLASTAALRAEVTEWLCEPCDTIHPEPDRSRSPLECACPKCGSFMRPTTMMSRALQVSLDEARAENARLREAHLNPAIRRSIMASARLGKWLSAALDDPNVCEEMKADIREWFSAGEPEIVQLARAALKETAS